MVQLGDVLRGVAAERGEREDRERLARGVNIQERGVSLAEEQLGFQQEQARATTKRNAADEAIENFEFVVDKVGERAAGPNPLGPQELEGIRASFTQAAEVLGPEAVAQLNQRLDLAVGVATPEQTAVAAGEAQLTTAETIAGELDPSQRAVLAGVGAQDPTGTRQLQTERNALLAQAGLADAEGDAQQATTLRREAQELTSAIAARGASPTFDPRVEVLQAGGREIEASRETISTSFQTMAALRGSIKGVVENPEAFGISGAIIKNVGGLIDQIGGENVVDAFSGGSFTEATAARTESEALVARLLPVITGDTSGRYTDTERRIADEIARSNLAKASPRQIVAAQTKLLNIERSATVREISGIAAVADLDLTLEQDVQSLLDLLEQLGASPEEADSIAADLFTFRRL